MNIRILTGMAMAAFAVSAANAQQTNDRAATYDTPNGPLTVTSGQPAPLNFGPPPPFANLANEYRSATQGGMQIQVSQGDVAATLVPYPQVSAALTAGDWNRAAGANNRIEIRLR